MRVRRWQVIAIVWLTAVPAAAADWRVDPQHSKLTVEIDQGGKPLTAHFEKYSGQVRFDPKDPGAAHVELSVDVASFRSGDAQRDQFASADEFLAASAAPTATYRTDSIAAEGGNRYRVVAELTLKGVTRKLSHSATIAIDGDEAHAQGTVELNRLDFGVGASQFPRGDQIGLTATVRFDLTAKRTG